MKVVVKRSGGYAGITETLADVDTANLDSASATKVEQLIRDAETAAKTIGQAQPIGADLRKYEVTLDDGGHQRTWIIVEDGSAQVEPVRRLLESLGR
jgi:hypothetical protein